MLKMIAILVYKLTLDVKYVCICGLIVKCILGFMITYDFARMHNFD